MQSVKHNLWIGTADIKDLYVVRRARKQNLSLPLLPNSFGKVWSRKYTYEDDSFESKEDIINDVREAFAEVDDIYEDDYAE